MASVTVQPGDTLSAIAAQAGVSLSELVAANPQIDNPNLIFPGQEVTLPGSTSAASAGGSTREDLEAVYRELLGRAPDPGGVSTYLGVPLEDVRSQILLSAEYRQRQIRLQSPSSPTPPPGDAISLEREALESSRRDAFSRIRDTLNRYGLGDLTDWAWNRITEDASEATVLLELQDQAAFKERFRAIDERRKKGLPAISPADVLEFERAARSMMRAAGLPEGFYDSPDDFTGFLVNDVSLSELQGRVRLAEQRVFNTDPVLRAERARFGLSSGDEVAMELDPDVAFPEIARRFASAALSASGVRTGFGPLDRSEAERLVDLGVSEDQASSGFAALASSRELFTPLAGTTETAIDRATQLDAVFAGDAEAAGVLRRRAERRRAPFEGGGRFTTTQEGFSGLGAS